VDALLGLLAIVPLQQHDQPDEQTKEHDADDQRLHCLP